MAAQRRNGERVMGSTGKRFWQLVRVDGKQRQGRSSGATSLPGEQVDRERVVVLQVLQGERPGGGHRVLVAERLSSTRASNEGHLAQQPCPTRPHEPSLARPSAQLNYPATRGFMMGAVAGIPGWQQGVRRADPLLSGPKPQQSQTQDHQAPAWDSRAGRPA
jgi:hypothetical protein